LYHKALKTGLSTILVLIICLLGTALHAQKTLVTGKVFDKNSGEPLPFVNIYFKDTKTGTTSDINGYYRIETYYATDSLLASMIGYGRLAMRVKSDKSQVVDFALVPSGISLNTVTVTADKKAKDPAVELMQKVVRNKAANNREKLDAYEYSTYNKIEFDMNNIGDDFKNRKVMKPFAFVFDNMDTTSEEKPFLPIFLTESFSRYYYRKNPKSSKEVIKATKVAGIKNESVSQFMGDMYQQTNIYDNYVSAFGKSFVSPVSDFGNLSYKYYLLDSAVLNNKYKCYKIAFKPRREGELVFEGEMWINDTTYAVKQIEATIGKDANLNWVNGFTVYHEYDQAEDEVWMLTKEKVLVDFNLAENAIGFYGRKTTLYSDFVINEPKGDSLYSSFNNIDVAEDANDKTDEYWENARPEKLSETETQVYDMVDTIQQLPAFRTYVDLITLFVSGYYERKYFDFGPYFTTFSFNAIEGPRLRLGGKTNADFSTKVEFSGYLAYGFKDQIFKYKAASRYFISKSPRQILSVSHTRDLEQLGQSSNAWKTDNILSSVFRRGSNNLLNAYEEYKANYEIEYFPGFSNNIGFNRRDIWSVGSIAFQRYNNEGKLYDINRIKTTELNVGFRFAFDEKFIIGELDRISLGTKYPVIQANATFGIKGFLNGQYEYQRVAVKIQDRIPLNPIGHSDITIEVGKIWGALPFPLLNIYNGNQTYFYDEYSFNLMNFYEFVGDEWATMFVVHHFNGLFFNKIPLFRKLKWREVASFRGAIGGLSNIHQTELDFPDKLNTLSKPYMEVGAGIENIFKLLRVDALWRLTYLDHENVVPFGIRVTYQLEF
jgi:hypothetical protein